MPLLSCHNLSLGYEGRALVTDLSFTVNAGDYLCVVGDNGSGKSTLIKTILRLKQPAAGRVVTGDGLKHDEIGYLPQQTAAQKDFPASVREVVLSGCLNRCGLRPFFSMSERRMAEEYMEQMGVARLAKRCYRELSGGQQQRALLARALCAARKALLLDEPAAGLDPVASVEMYELIERLNDGGVTIIMVSHDIAAALKYASHILHIGTRQAAFFGTKAEYINSGAGDAYLENNGYHL